MRARMIREIGKLALLLSVLTFSQIAAQSKQLLVVSTSNWTSSSGSLQRYEKKSNGWKKVGTSISVKVGKNGLAWGRGMHRVPKGTKRIKREGDGKAPAGIFSLPFVFSEYNIEIPYPHKKMTNLHHCVDDSRSKYYNKVVDSSKIKKDYRSFEHMKFPSGLYSYGIFVNHNPNHVPMAGSCIFIHIKKANGKPTVGCTAMSKSSIKNIIHWLDPSKRPLLIQAPKGFIKKLLQQAQRK